MATTFPLVSPESYGLAHVQWSAVSNDSYGFNPFSLDLIRQLYDGKMWRGILTIMTQDEPDGRALSAWLTSLRQAGTNAGSFLLGDPAATAPIGSALTVPGTPLVDGAAQTGATLNVDGLPLSATGYLKAGDYIQIGTGATARLKKCLDDVDSDGSGLAAMNLWPPIRTAPADGSAVVVTSAQGLFVSPGAVSTWGVRPPKLHDGIVINVTEVVP